MLTVFSCTDPYRSKLGADEAISVDLGSVEAKKKEAAEKFGQSQKVGQYFFDWYCKSYKKSSLKTLFSVLKRAKKGGFFSLLRSLDR